MRGLDLHQRTRAVGAGAKALGPAPNVVQKKITRRP
jgi:hypothetical protein